MSALATRVSAESILKTLVNEDYEIAKLLLDKQPALNYQARINQFLSNPIKGRSLEQLHGDYQDVIQNVHGDVKEELDKSYITGWSYHDPEGALNWLANHVADKQTRKQAYQSVLAAKPDNIMNIMLAKHGESEYETMMMAIAESSFILTDQQNAQFRLKNRYEPANNRSDLVITITESRIEIPAFSMQRLSATEGMELLIIPHR